MADIPALAGCFDHPNSPLHPFFEGCVMDICAGGNPQNVYCETLDALVELCEELLQTAIGGNYRQVAGCGMKSSVHKSLMS